MERVEIELDGRTISLEAGDLARQAGGSVIVRQGDTMVLVAATMAPAIPTPRAPVSNFNQLAEVVATFVTTSGITRY